jgi:hypothetical protein
MSFGRFIYYCAVIGGFGAFLGWLVAELIFASALRQGSIGVFGVMTAGGIVGAAIGMGINLVAGTANAQWKVLLRRAVAGLVCGLIGGAVGGLVGNVLFVYAKIPRSIGWLIMGLGIGVADGIYDRSKKKIRNGLIGGAVGGLVAGILFDLFPWIVGQMSGLSSSSGMSSRATGFVVTGVSIGALIGLAHVVLKQAWLTVMDGYRTGRQLILTQEVTVLGRGDHLPLPFLGPANKDLDMEHLSILWQPSGSYVLEDHQTRLGTLVNNQPVTGPVPLKDGDIIRLGANLLRFNERQRRQSDVSPVESMQSPGHIAPPPPPGSPAGRSEPPPLPTSTAPDAATGGAGPEQASPSPPPPPSPRPSTTSSPRQHGSRIPPPPPPPTPGD